MREESVFHKKKNENVRCVGQLLKKTCWKIILKGISSGLVRFLLATQIPPRTQVATSFYFLFKIFVFENFTCG